MCKLSRCIQPNPSSCYLQFVIFLSLYSYEVAPRSDSEDESGSEYEEEVCVFWKNAVTRNTVKTNAYLM